MSRVIRSMYDGNRVKVALSCGKSMTQQHFKDECDINCIMDKYAVTGYLVDPLKVVTAKPQFGDFTAVPDYQTAQNIIVEGREAFEALPARIRKYFDNDPALYLSFISDGDNLDEAIKMGLVDPDYVDDVKKSLEPVPVEPAPIESESKK